MTAPPTPKASALLRWLPVAVLVAATLVHLPTLDQPLLERHNFRQTQTAFTARIFHEQGIDLLHPKLPVLGPPWEVPFEFPLFQAGASLAMDVGVAEDSAMRITGFASFLLAAGLLWLLVRRQVGALGALIALGVFAFSPLGMQWSRAALIEYLALAASIGFALAGLTWRERPTGRWFVLAFALGSIATMVKITTALFWVAPFALLGIARDDLKQTTMTRAANWALSIGPILAGVLWTRHADAIKAASDATAWLTSSALLEWNVGSVAQRLDSATWERTLYPLLVLSGGIVLPLLIIPIVRFARLHEQSRFVGWIAVTLVGPVLLFYNLYFQHDYYAIATSASVAILVGVGVIGLSEIRWRLTWAAVVGVVVMSVVVWVACIPYWSRIYEPISDPEGVLPLAAQIERETAPDQPVAIIGRDWQPSILYYAHRWGWMIRGAEIDPALHVRLLADGYAIYRCPWLSVIDHCTRLDVPALGVPVPGATFGPVSSRTGLLASGT